MAKGNRQRKRDRVRHQAKAARKRASAARREAESMVSEAMARHRAMLDPALPVADAAALISENYPLRAVPIFLARRMAEEGSSAERLAEIAGVLLAGTGAPGGAEPSGGDSGGGDSGGGESLAALTFAASVAYLAGDAATARLRLDQAAAVAREADGHGDGDGDARLRVIHHVSATERVADAIEMLEERLREDPDDDFANEIYGLALERARERHERYERHEQGEQGEPGEACPCGAGSPWRECCAPRERAALSRFTDRSGLVALRDAVSAYLAASEYGPAVEERVAEVMVIPDDLNWAPEEATAFRLMATEVALLTATPGDAGGEEGAGDDAGGEEGAGDDAAGEEDDDDGALSAFAADPATPPALAARARAWCRHAQYGLWRVDDRRAAPGLWCTDLSTGVSRYVEFPAEVAAQMPRWAVWLGAIVPVDGIWRTTGVGSRLSPAEGDAVAEYVVEVATDFVSALTGRARSRNQDDAIRFGRAEPRGVYVDFEDPVELAAPVIGKVVAIVLPRVLAEVHARRSAPPDLVNTDGDPMCLITATIAVSDGARAAERLAAMRDFELAEDGPSRLTWYGVQVPADQRRALMAEALAQVRADGHQDAEFADDEEPSRWIRGTLDVSGDVITVAVNSQRRLDRLLGVLGRIGQNPEVTDEKRIDPAQDLAWSGGLGAAPRGAAPAADGWEKYWLDTAVPALRGRTPRQAAQGDGRVLLEAMLRQFEYEADLLAAAGKAGVDTAWLRQELDMQDL